jgi:DNA-binding MarR family transcriptional regulator
MSVVTVPEEEAPLEALADDLCWLLGRVNSLLQTESTAALRELDITPREHQVLVGARAGEHTQTDLARILGLDKTTLMVALDDLERAGLAERRPMPSDRRARIVAVTPAGERVLERADKALTNSRAGILALLPPDDRAAFIAALGRLACAHEGDLPACGAAALAG